MGRKVNVLSSTALLHIFNDLGIKRGRLLDIGAWDGVYESNSRVFVEKDWESYLIEGDKKKFNSLVMNNLKFSKSQCFNVMVSTETRFDQLLNLNHDQELDLLTIDIDGFETSIINLLLIYNPKIIVTEFNPTISLDIYLADLNKEYFGSSLSGITAMLQDSHTLIGILGADAFYLRNDLFQSEKVYSKYFPANISFPRYFFAYNGQLIKSDTSLTFRELTSFINTKSIISQNVQENFNVPWHLMQARQPLAKIFRSWPIKQIERLTFIYYRYYYKFVSIVKKL